MTKPLLSDRMATAYAQFRPSVCTRIIERVRSHLPTDDIGRAVDVGCGVGLSTQALDGLAKHVIGIDPVESHLKWARVTAQNAEFLVGAPNAVPLRDRSVDLVSVAGSDSVDFSLLLNEAQRVLAPGGVVVAYDFQPGMSLANSEGLGEWFDRFAERYPWPEDEAAEINPPSLADLGFHVLSDDFFSLAVPLALEFYVTYLMMETNVAFAITNGVPEEEIWTWCVETLSPIWAGERAEVIFTAAFVVVRLDSEA